MLGGSKLLVGVNRIGTQLCVRSVGHSHFLWSAAIRTAVVY